MLAKADWSRVPSLKPLTYEFVEADVENIRKNGYAVTEGEATEGTIGIAAPIFSYDHRVVGCISVAGPTFRFPPLKLSEARFLVMRTAREISGELGWRGANRKQGKNLL
ncbi:MAG TPA: IclR family transcriptional regulator C-terminal domain-containing protein [Paenibacillus sp.]|nr:IclR family transcriptional regulator C-terminal domain-containing protein [Paenibacillus sp.]HZG88555.1 IclR family transcriptional regulator C-terminal domain-containing protein [Paenibacillus sp.]